MAVNFNGAAKRLDDIDLPTIGATIGVGEDVLHALLEVETTGSGFDNEGRPKLLFEPHKFYRHLSGEKRQRAVDAGLAYPKWGQKKYPRNSYPRMQQAIEIDETAALMSGSWGLGQIMGENFRMCGYASVQEMVEAFADSEAAQLEAMVEFIKSAGIDDDLRRIQQISDGGRVPSANDWIPIVRVYNGAGFAKNDYHNRAAKAFAKWRRIKDTPFGRNAKLKEMAEVESADAEAAEAVFEPVEPPAVGAEPVAAPAIKTDGSIAKAGEAVPSDAAKPGEAVVGGRPGDPPKQVTTGGGISRLLTGIGGLAGVGTAVGGFVKGNTGIIMVSIVCITILILVLIFRQIILDYVRMQLGASPDKYNVR